MLVSAFVGLWVTLFASLAAVPSAAADDFLCDGEIATIVGTHGKDVLVGTNGPDVIVGLDQADIIDGGAGDDVICGGRGQDVIKGGAGNDRIFGQQNRFFAGGEFPDSLDGGPGDDWINGGASGNGDTLVFSSDAQVSPSMLDGIPRMARAAGTTGSLASAKFLEPLMTTPSSTSGP